MRSRLAGAVLAAVALAALLAPARAAQAVGAGACVITGTIIFTPSAAASERGAWDISPGVIRCRGTFRRLDQMVGEGTFSGAGSYTVVPSGEGHCLRSLGTGTVDYWITTEKQDVHMKEPHSFLLAGAGVFTTPTLRGSFQIPAYEGNCLTSPVSRAVFLAEVTMVRLSGTEV
ncbi:MAG TPA: hypothetical protein VGR20_07985 [Acidimicrobiia bacterium]|jgi:hypothetical protein|nr:hypothetical protein [Acidimicrobiia bacterium]